MNLKLVIYALGISYFLLNILLQPVVVAETTLGEGIDCTAVSVDYKEDPSLTKQERIRKMDEAFIESLNKFELCQSIQKQKSGSAAGGASGGGGQNSDQGGAEGADGELGESTASATMKGTEQAEASVSDGGEEATSTEVDSGSMTAQNDGMDAGNMASSNGKLPEDIPSAENDDMLAAQIRYAAENETDPVKKQQLWNEYRKYKGLAPK